MAMSINDKMLSDGASIYYTERVRTMMESHMPYLRSSPFVTARPIEPSQANKYEGDLQGLLMELGVSPKNHWFFMRLNDMDGFEDVTPELRSLLMISESSIDQLMSVYQTAVKKMA